MHSNHKKKIILIGINILIIMSLFGLGLLYLYKDMPQQTTSDVISENITQKTDAGNESTSSIVVIESSSLMSSEEEETEYKNIDGAHDFNNFERLIQEISNATQNNTEEE